MAISKSKQLRMTSELRRQLGFMRRSCEAFDQGDEDEAIRLSALLRIMFHTGGQSVSLITHLGLGDSKILSSSQGHGDWRDYIAVQMSLTSTQPMRAIPLLGDKFSESSIKNWWEHESVFVYKGKRYSRRSLIRSAADKDGGAHVDEELEEYYEALCTGIDTIGIVGQLEYSGQPPFPQGVPLYPQNVHLALLRQFSHEILASVDRFGWLKGEDDG